MSTGRARAGTLIAALALVGSSVTGVVAGSRALASSAPAPHHGIEIEARHLSLGDVLTSSKGRVMYIYAKDEPKVSRCTGACLTAWPAVLSPARPEAKDGVLAGHLARTSKHQVTYYGHPLYYFSGDSKPREASGQNVGSFLVITVHGMVVKPTKKPTAPKAPSGPTKPAVVSTATAGGKEVIASANGHTLYAFSQDSPPSFGCTSGCTGTWPPLLTSGTPTASGDAMAALLGSVKRPDGTTQVTYNGRPVYGYVGDSAAGEDNGQGVDFDYWSDLFPSGDLNPATSP